MTNLLLFLILIVLIAQLFDKHKRSEDLSKEDKAVKLATEDLSEAKDRIPH